MIRAKSLSHAERLLKLCLNSVQDLISNNAFKFSTSRTVCAHFCYQRKQYAEPFIMLDKHPIIFFCVCVCADVVDEHIPLIPHSIDFSGNL